MRVSSGWPPLPKVKLADSHPTPSSGKSLYFARMVPRRETPSVSDRGASLERFGSAAQIREETSDGRIDT